MQLEVTHVEVRLALDEVLLDAACSGYNAVHHLVLAEVADNLAHSAADHVRSVAQENRAAYLFSLLWFGQQEALALLHGLIA